jgi:hypothetical protein
MGRLGNGECSGVLLVVEKVPPSLEFLPLSLIVSLQA